MIARRGGLAISLSWVAVAIGLSGLLTVGYLAVVTRGLHSGEYGWFGAFWALALLVGFGAFLPVELELARLVHLRGTPRPLPAGTLVAVAGVMTAVLLLLLAGAPLVLPALGREPSLYVALVLVCLVSGAQFLLRGLLLGRGAYGTHGGVMLLDSGIRVAGAVAVAAAVSSPTAGSFGWTLPAAIGLAHLPFLARELLGRRAAPPSPEVPDPQRRDTVRAVAHLVVGCLCAQVLLNGVPVVVAGLAAGSEHEVAARFVASFTLLRLPLFVAVPLQSALVPGLTALHATGDRRALRTVLSRLLLSTLGLAAVGAVVGGLAGPPVIGLLSGPGYALSGADMGLLSAGACLYAGMLVAAQALIAAGRHRASTAAWGCGLAAAAGLFAAVPDLVLRAGLAFTGGSAVALAAAAVLLLRGPRPAPRAPSAGGPALSGATPTGAA